MIPTQDQLAAAYEKAPSVVQEFITSPALSVAFTTIRENHKLHLDEAGALSSALNAVFLEVVPYEQFPSLLKEALEQNSGAYDAVLKEINDTIFSAFRSNLAKPQSSVPNASPLEEVARTVSSASAVPPSVNTKLEHSVRQAPQEVEIKADAQKNAGYTASADPYREPIE